MKKDKRIFGKVIMVLAVLFFYVPILYVMVFSFNESKSLTRFTGFSLEWYEKMFSRRPIMDAVYYMVVIALIAKVVSTIIGTINAIGLSKSRSVLREVVLQTNEIP
mgnify:CR=1 FL=1